MNTSAQIDETATPVRCTSSATTRQLSSADSGLPSASSTIHSIASMPIDAAKPNSSRQRAPGNRWMVPSTGGSNRPCIIATRVIDVVRSPVGRTHQQVRPPSMTRLCPVR